MATLVVRFSSLGDVVLAGAVTGGLAPVCFLTLPRWAPVARLLPGVERVVAWGQDPIPADITRVVDLHASARSRWVCARIPAPVRRVHRHDLRRRARVWFKVGAPPPRVVERYALAAGVPAAPLPWISVPRAARDHLTLVPGAAWATKRWPTRGWLELAARWPGPIDILGGPGEVEVVRELASDVGSRAHPIVEQGFEKTLQALGRSRVCVAGDTGLLHLAAASGAPVVGIFGPTTAADGFWCYPGRAVELDLPCRPCSRHGGTSCPMMDHLCLEGLSVDTVWQAVLDQAGDP